MRGQKGITLVALIITIVVLLILSVVAITAVSDSGIVEYANNGAADYTDSQKQENSTINGYVNYLKNYSKQN